MPVYSPTPPFAEGRETSMLAALSVAEHTSALRWKVYRLIAKEGLEGLTCDEVEILTGLKHQTASARVYELHKGGYIVDSDKRRKTRSNRDAIVWVSFETDLHLTPLTPAPEPQKQEQAQSPWSKRKQAINVRVGSRGTARRTGY